MAVLTVDGLVASARTELSDGSRWSTASLIQFLNDAIQTVITWRPDLLLSDADSLLTVSKVSAGGSLVWDEMVPGLRASLVDLVCASALRVDGDDTVNVQRAAEYEAQARGRMVGDFK